MGRFLRADSGNFRNKTSLKPVTGVNAIENVKALLIDHLGVEGTFRRNNGTAGKNLLRLCSPYRTWNYHFNFSDRNNAIRLARLFSLNDYLSVPVFVTRRDGTRDTVHRTTT